MGRARVLLILAVAACSDGAETWRQPPPQVETSPEEKAEDCRGFLELVVEPEMLKVLEDDTPDRRASPYFPAYAESRQIYLMIGCPSSDLDELIQRHADHWNIPLNHL